MVREKLEGGEHRRQRSWADDEPSSEDAEKAPYAETVKTPFVSLRGGLSEIGALHRRPIEPRVVFDLTAAPCIGFRTYGLCRKVVGDSCFQLGNRWRQAARTVRHHPRCLSQTASSV